MHVFCLGWHLEFAEFAECNLNFKRLLSLTFFNAMQVKWKTKYLE